MDSKTSKGPCLCKSGSTHAGKTAVCERRCCSDGGHAGAQRQRSARNAAGRIDQKSPSRTETLKSSEGGREAGCAFAAAGGARGSPSVAHARGEAACTTARTSVRLALIKIYCSQLKCTDACFAQAHTTRKARGALPATGRGSDNAVESSQSGADEEQRGGLGALRAKALSKQPASCARAIH